jgi:flagellar hook-basal body complex protein FliE
MAIGPIGPVGPIAVPALGSTAPAAGANPTSGADFASALGHGMDNLQATQAKADDLAVKAATGSLTDVHEYMIAATEASLTTQLTVAVRNKALDAFNDIMRMQA